MAASEINMKQISEDLKSFLTKEMENNAKKITEKIIEKWILNLTSLAPEWKQKTGRHRQQKH